MERATNVAVFESNQPNEIKLIQSKLNEAQIPNFLDDQEPADEDLVVENMKRLLVNINDESVAFQIIDQALQEL